MEREITFATGDVSLVVRTALKAFVHVNLDPTQPPRAIGVEFIGDSAHPTKRVVWGDAKALGGNAIAGGPLPLPGTYARLDVDALATGLGTGATYTGIRLLQSGGAVWWDRMGAVCTSPSAAEDPLLSAKAWKREYGDEVRRSSSSLPLEIKYTIRLADYFQTDADRQLLAEEMPIATTSMRRCGARSNRRRTPPAAGWPSRCNSNAPCRRR